MFVSLDVSLSLSLFNTLSCSIFSPGHSAPTATTNLQGKYKIKLNSAITLNKLQPDRACRCGSVTYRRGKQKKKTLTDAALSQITDLHRRAMGWRVSRRLHRFCRRPGFPFKWPILTITVRVRDERKRTGDRERLQKWARANRDH